MPHTDSFGATECNFGICLSEETKKTVAHPLPDDVQMSLWDNDCPTGGIACNEFLENKFSPMLKHKLLEDVNKLIDDLQGTVARGNCFCFSPKVVHSAPVLTVDDEIRQILWLALKPKMNNKEPCGQQMNLSQWMSDNCGPEHACLAKLWSSG